MTEPDLLCDAFNVLFIAQMMHSPFIVPSVKVYTEVLHYITHMH